MTSGTSSGGTTSATAAEEPFNEIKSLLFSSSSSSSMDISYTLSILHKALSHPRIFAGYAELHSHPLINETLSKSKLGTQMLNTLQLFAFGVYEDYVKAAEQNKYCPLSAQEVMKLRVLSVITLVQSSCNGGSDEITLGAKKMKKKRSIKKGSNSSSSCVPYKQLYQSLDIPTTDIRQLEDVLIHSIYTHAILGKLDQKNMCLRILPSSSSSTSGFIICASRDVDVEQDVPRMIGVLEEFYKRGEALLSTLETCAEKGRNVREEDYQYWMNVEQRITKNRIKVSKNLSMAASCGGGKGKGAGASGGMMLAEEGIMAAAEGAGAGGVGVWTNFLESSGGDGRAVAAAVAAGASSNTRGRQSKRSRGVGGGGGAPSAPGPTGGGAYGRF
mmetsp:Transcript_21695/g.28566  ORF Transcript_21695/g.28566 Transcript_21695/m.28566 type:complete len:387 (+) Transcript_21695:160-1320(+)